MSITIASKKITIPTSVLKSQKFCGSLDNLHVNNREKRRKIEMDTLQSVFRDIQRSNKGPTRLKKKSQYNEPSFCPLIRFQNTKNNYWSSENNITPLKTYGMIISTFSMSNKDNRERFFE